MGKPVSDLQRKAHIAFLFSFDVSLMAYKTTHSGKIGMHIGEGTVFYPRTIYGATLSNVWEKLWTDGSALVSVPRVIHRTKIPKTKPRHRFVAYLSMEAKMMPRINHIGTEMISAQLAPLKNANDFASVFRSKARSITTSISATLSGLVR